MNRFLCMVCNMDTNITNEYYMVQDEIWNEVTKNLDHDGMLCVGCLEDILGRKLTEKDFTNCPVNDGIFGLSERILNRMGSHVPR